MYSSTVKFLSKMYDFIDKNKKIKPSAELERACEYLNLDKKEAENTAKASVSITLIVSILSIISAYALLLTNSLSLVTVAGLIGIPVIINHLYSNYYKDAYYSTRIKDLGSLPDFFSVLISNLKIKPNLEHALYNASSFEYGKITRDSKRLFNELNKGKTWSVKDEFLRMTKQFDNVSVNKAATTLITSLSVKDNHKRRELLNSSLHYLLKGMVLENNRFSKNLYMPVLLLFGFGTILPLVFVSIIPVISVLKGGAFDINTITLFFVSSLLATKLMVDNLKKISPSRFSQLEVQDEEKGLNPVLLTIIFLGISSPTIIYLFSKILSFRVAILEGYQALFASAALFICFSLYYYSKSHKLIKEKVKAEILEREIVEAFQNLGGRINEGRSVEDSLKYTSDVLSGSEAKNLFKTAYHKIKDAGLSIEQVFSKIHFIGRIISNRVLSLSNMFVKSVKKHSSTAGENIIEVSHYYNAIYESEEEMNNSMSKNTDMIKLTMTIFTPMVCGLVINMQRLINNIQPLNNSLLSFSFGTLDTEIIQFLVSNYVFFLTIILNYFYCFITYNNEVISTQYSAFKSLITSFIVFTATLIISKFLLF